MIKNKLPVRYTGQHFTIDKVLIDDAIKIAKINESDTVIDIGAGKGFLTVHLVRQCTNIIAIENDKSLLSILKNKFSNNTNVKIIDCDFRCGRFKYQVRIYSMFLLKTNIGDLKFNFSLGLLLILFCIYAKYCIDMVFILNPFGTYCLISILAFSTAPFCHGA